MVEIEHLEALKLHIDVFPDAEKYLSAYGRKMLRMLQFMKVQRLLKEEHIMSGREFRILRAVCDICGKTKTSEEFEEDDFPDGWSGGCDPYGWCAIGYEVSDNETWLNLCDGCFTKYGLDKFFENRLEAD